MSFDYLRTIRMVLKVPQAVAVEFRIAEHDAAGIDESDAPLKSVASCVG
jgi:hypothetical protein